MVKYNTINNTVTVWYPAVAECTTDCSRAINSNTIFDSNVFNFLPIKAFNILPPSYQRRRGNRHRRAAVAVTVAAKAAALLY